MRIAKQRKAKPTERWGQKVMDPEWRARLPQGLYRSMGVFWLFLSKKIKST